MREIRLSGSEGGGAEVIIGPPYPYHKILIFKFWIPDKTFGNDELNSCKNL